MIKIMLVEDDKGLREIYGVRLLAEGYDIVSAGDGEEALAMAIKERPQLIISDVMMPKVSGYDMLDILRSTTETKNIRVIMMTALSSEEQRSRAESLGADRYLVKSQVGIEDVVRVVHEVLGDNVVTAPPVAPPQQPAATTTPIPAQPMPQTTPTPAPMVPPAATRTITMPSRPVQPTMPPETTFVAAQPLTPPPTTPLPPVVTTTNPIQPTPPTPPGPPLEPAFNEPPKPASLKTRIIQPLNDPYASPVDINDLLNKELAKEASLHGGVIDPIPTISEEKDMIAEQLRSFHPPEPTPVEPPAFVTPPTAPPVSVLPTPGVNYAQTSPMPPTQVASATPTPQPTHEEPSAYTPTGSPNGL